MIILVGKQYGVKRLIWRGGVGESIKDFDRKSGRQGAIFIIYENRGREKKEWLALTLHGADISLWALVLNKTKKKGKKNLPHPFYPAYKWQDEQTSVADINVVTVPQHTHIGHSYLQFSSPPPSSAPISLSIL